MSQMLKAERLYQAHQDKLAGRTAAAGTLRGVTPLVEKEGINQFIPGYEQASPRTQGEKLTEFLSSQLHAKNIKPVRIFSMADK